MSTQRWMIALSPDGAARMVSDHVAHEFAARTDIASGTFDTYAHRQGFSRLLKENNDDVVADLVSQSLIVSCLEFQATHLLVLALAPVTLFALGLLRRSGIKTIHWFYEDYRRAPYWRDVLAGYDHFCAVQKGPLPGACRAAGAEFHFLPTAAAAPLKTAQDAPERERELDIAFIGVASLYRIALLEELVKTKLTVAIAGSGWESYKGPLQPCIVCTRRWTTEEESFALLARAKIGLNCSVNVPDSESQVSPRAYDIIAAGCVLLTENVQLLAESLPDCSPFTFDTPEEAVLSAEKIVAGYAEIRSCLETNRSAVMHAHRYSNRVETLLRFAG
ncbi:MAG: glycosyltransferase [Chitinispirillaceae bacterium]|jgi:hypothetical protein|nr:glycosyltransferase [Chitinispirillaceae bacterium]